MADDPYGDLPPIGGASASSSAASTPSTNDPYGDLPPVGGRPAPGAITNPGVPGFVGSPVNAAQRAAVKATTDFGNFMNAGHKDPIGAFLGKLQGGQRMLQAIGTQAFGNPQSADGSVIDPMKALMNPATAPEMQARSDAWMGLGPGGAVTSALGSGNGNLAQKIALGGAHAIADGVTNPISYVAPAKIAKTVADVIPGATPALAAAGKAIGNSPLGAMFNPDYYLRGLTDQGKALYENITNKAMETVRGQKQVEDAAVKAAAPQIRAGVMPPEIAQLFTADKGQAADQAWRKYFPDGLQVGQNPADVQMALYNNRAPVFQGLAMPELKKAGFFNSPSSIAAGRSMGTPDLFDVPSEGLGNASAQVTNGAPHPIIELQKRLAANLEPPTSSPNIVQKIAQTLTQRGNQAFLANPVPHVGNLTNLAYNKYGLPTALQGLGNAARIATGTVGDGHLVYNIGQLADTGTNSQYGNIFNELGLTGLKNSSATNPLATAYNATLAPASRVAARAVNPVLVGAQKLSNAAQNTILNPVETGLRSAALDAENAAGTDPLQAMRNIHSTFGTGAPNAVTQGLKSAAVPFAGFHFQTAPGSVFNTLANNPGRIVNTIQAERDMNNATGANYRSTVPGANAARMMADPLGYFGSPGGMLGLEGPYSILTNAKNKGPGLVKAAGGAISKFIPGSEPGLDAAGVGAKVFNNALNGGPPVDYRPLFNAAFGGYTAK